MEQALNGISVVPVEERIYPAGNLARPVVGKMGVDRALYGLEWQFNQALEGEAGIDRHERSVFGVISVGEREVEPATKGDDVYLTIDQNIQYVVEEALIQHCQDTLANSAQAVVSDPRTGEILAMATVLRTEDGDCVVPIYNAPLVDTFEPGSVIKMVTAAAAVEELGWDSATTFDVPNSIVVEDKEFFEHDEHPVAPYPVAQIIGQSMNVGTIMMGQAVGPEKLSQYLAAFGFGQETGLGFKDEASGRVRPYDEWYGSDIGSISIGQGMSTNTVQLAMAYNTIANDGVYLAPKLVRSIVSADGTEEPQPSQVTRRVISPESAAEVKKMLTAVVDPNGIGTGRAAAVPGYTVAGKTGTAWKVFEDENGDVGYGYPGNRRYVVTFAGFLPAEDPQLSIVVVVDEPKTQTSAGLVAAPVFADVAHYVVRIMGIAPEHDALAPGEVVRGTPAAVTDEPLTETPIDGGETLEVETLDLATTPTETPAPDDGESEGEGGG
ncbi:MAG: penicillin-binding protein 2 [Acidimicrobiales bacterium]